MSLQDEINWRIKHLIDEEVEKRLENMDIYDIFLKNIELNNKVKELKEKINDLDMLKITWSEGFILFIPMLLGGMIGSFLGTLIYNLLI